MNEHTLTAWGRGSGDPTPVALEWAMILRQPLIPTIRRAVVEESMTALCQQEEAWAMWWLGGQIADHVLTLPAEDPWRHLSARAGRLTRGESPPEADGAVGCHGSFGTVIDGADLVAPIEGAPDGDLAPLESGLMPASSVLLAFAADGHEAIAAAWAATRGHGHVTMFSAFSEALVWAMWRRRVYVGMEDSLNEVSATGWLWRADTMLTQWKLRPEELKQLATEREAQRVPDGQYTELLED